MVCKQDHEGLTCSGVYDPECEPDVSEVEPTQTGLGTGIGCIAVFIMPYTVISRRCDILLLLSSKIS
jgi:hypothetical protein